MTHASDFFAKAAEVCAAIDIDKIEVLATELVALRERGGRLFFIGVGGSAANCSHAVNDFRKLCGIEAYTPVDNVAELTARANDEGLDSIFEPFLFNSECSKGDAVFVLSVGGGNKEANVSTCIVRALEFAEAVGAKIFGIVGKSEGYTSKVGDVVIVIPEVMPEWVTPLSESFQALVWHCLVSHPALQIRKTKW